MANPLVTTVWFVLSMLSISLDVFLYLKDRRDKRRADEEAMQITALTSRAEEAERRASAAESLLADAAKNTEAMNAVMLQHMSAYAQLNTSFELHIQTLVRRDAAINDLSQVLSGVFNVMESEEDRRVLNEAWKQWHARNFPRLPEAMV